MSIVKEMSRREFLKLPSYNKDTLQVGKSYKLFGSGYNEKANIAYIKTITSKDGDNVKTKIFEIHIK